jgi:nucleotide-binding universal stress UspA family protein
MYKSILVPLDGSHRAERILSHVEQLALHLGSRLILLRVVEPDFSGVGAQGTPAEFFLDAINRKLEEAEAYLSAKQGELRQGGITVRILVESGPVVSTITDVSARENVDLVAMASHGRGGLSRVFYGSVAAGVLQRVDRPLLLVRADD